MKYYYNYASNEINLINLKKIKINPGKNNIQLSQTPPPDKFLTEIALYCSKSYIDVYKALFVLN